MTEEKDLESQDVAKDLESEVGKAKVKMPERQDMTTLHERTIASLSYISFLAIIPFYLKKDSEFCRFHGKQGLLLAIIFFLTTLFSVIDLVSDFVKITQVVIFFIMAFSALSGRWREMPFIYKWSCQLEDALSLKSKEEEAAEDTHEPNETPDAQVNADQEPVKSADESSSDDQTI